MINEARLRRQPRSTRDDAGVQTTWIAYTVLKAVVESLDEGEVIPDHRPAGPRQRPAGSPPAASRRRCAGASRTCSPSPSFPRLVNAEVTFQVVREGRLVAAPQGLRQHVEDAGERRATERAEASRVRLRAAPRRDRPCGPEPRSGPLSSWVAARSVRPYLARDRVPQLGGLGLLGAWRSPLARLPGCGLAGRRGPGPCWQPFLPADLVGPGRVVVVGRADACHALVRAAVSCGVLGQLVHGQLPQPGDQLAALLGRAPQVGGRLAEVRAAP